MSKRFFQSGNRYGQGVSAKNIVANKEAKAAVNGPGPIDSALSTFYSLTIENPAIEKHWNIVGAIALVLMAVLLYSASLKSPYHLDSALYLKTSASFVETGDIGCFYSTRCMVGYLILPFFLLIGANALPIVIVGTAVLAFYLYYNWISGILGKEVALISAILLFSIPASFITITHLKEDFVALFFFLAGIYLLNAKESWKRHLSPICVGLAALSKETMMIFLPFYFAYAYVRQQEIGSIRDLVSKENIVLGLKIALPMAVIFVATILAINPSQLSDVLGLSKSPYLGQFLGVVSVNTLMGLGLWNYGVGSVLFLLQFLGIYLIIIEKDERKKILFSLLFFQGMLVAIFSINSTVVHYRHFIWTSFVLFPLMCGGLFESIKRKISIKSATIVLLMIAALLSIWLISMALPATIFRSQYNPVQGFYASAQIPKNSVLLGMDSCSLAEYYTNATCTGHVVDGSETDANELEGRIDDLLENGTAVYVLPDFASYDQYGYAEKSLEKYDSNSTYTGWYEDYHAMSYGYSYQEVLMMITDGQPDCVSYFSQLGHDMAGNQAVDIISVKILCGDEIYEDTYFSVGGRIMPYLVKDDLIQITGKNR